MKKIAIQIVLLAFPLLLTSLVNAQVHTFTNEHADINLNYSGGVWGMDARDEDNSTAYTPANALFTVPNAAIISRPAGSIYDFTGVSAGQNLYVLPQAQNPDLVFLGVSAAGVAPSTQWDRYNIASESGNRLVGTGRWLRLKLESVMDENGGVAPGQFSLWQDGFSGPTPFMSTSNGIVNTGTATDDSLWVIAGGHSHYNWAFSAPGTYKVRLRPSGYLNNNDDTTLGTFTESTQAFDFLFQVGSAAIPEPSTLLLFLSATGFITLKTKKYHSQGNEKI
jgi:surface-anchored protein